MCAVFLGCLKLSKLPENWMATVGRKAEGKGTHFSAGSTAEVQCCAT